MASKLRQTGKIQIGENTRNWRRRLEDTYGFLELVRQSRSPDDLCDCFLAYAWRFGATNLLAGQIPPRGASRREQLSHVLLETWPKECSLRYFSSGYLYHDPTIRLVCRDSPPFLWKEASELCATDGLAGRVMMEAAEFRLRDGLTMALRTLEGKMVGFSIAGERLEVEPGHGQALQLIAAYALSHAIVLVDGERPRDHVHLSARQLDVLRWAAEGLTVDEIGERLTISSNTADSHLRAVRQRLGVTNTVHAVAEAFRLGLIS
ncbi:LuxR family transcriptional regulator [Mesorhizobium sp. LSHC414A00]|uniref:helix-turn-helix transcriptional regulator n=1 Tax=Mesorhizobium sp. LSHC414A00 TaxID=1287287 RepID=UPI0003CE8313|nr:LuxR family transcriptional regulator [Mesorhizobium sp. LSHC414A00]ESX78122.1 LuxR family transcriptional regulator [Mesorhizobium sp. LSHC414A00]